jgi:VIT1/CCC1 family predicted Fe2+/Mn2+ transporter
VPGPADSWYHEKESAWLYRAVAAAETDPGHRTLFEKLAAAAEAQAGRWRQADPGIDGKFTPALRARAAVFGASDGLVSNAALVMGAAAAGVGVLLSLFTGHGALRGGLRLVLIGGGAGLAAWAVGKLLGAGLG